jgi:hypothetical protein
MIFLWIIRFYVGSGCEVGPPAESVPAVCEKYCGGSACA